MMVIVDLASVYLDLKTVIDPSPITPNKCHAKVPKVKVRINGNTLA